TFDIDMAPDPNSVFPLLTQSSGNYLASNLGPNSYSFTATASTGCSSTKTFTVQDNPVVAQLLNNQITITDAEYCTALLEQKASVVVSNVQLASGSNENIKDYQFDWLNSVPANVFS